MKKYLFSILSLLVVVDAFGAITKTIVDGFETVFVKNCDYVTLTEIKNESGDKYVIQNSAVLMNDFSEWQSWNTIVDFGSNVSLYVKDLNFSNSGEKVNNITPINKVYVTVKDVNNLYKTRLTAYDEDVFLFLVRETNYTKVFKDSRGSFLDNIRLKAPDDKMLARMDVAKSMDEINSAMNSAYHFNPMILMNPVKTINRGAMIDVMKDMSDYGLGADVEYVLSDKVNDYGAHIYFADKYDKTYFKLAVNLNSFSYGDDFNDFSGFLYGLDLRARHYMDDVWFDGILGLNRAGFKADDIYSDGNVTSNPKGMSEYARLSVGYDYKRFDDFIVAPFAGLLFQKSDIMNFSDTNVNLHTGLIGKYNFVMDGIKYEYAASMATDEKANWNLGADVGFVSLVDDAGARFVVNVFQDDFGTNYKFTINANVKF